MKSLNEIDGFHHAVDGWANFLNKYLIDQSQGNEAALQRRVQLAQMEYTRNEIGGITGFDDRTVYKVLARKDLNLYGFDYLNVLLAGKHEGFEFHLDEVPTMLRARGIGVTLEKARAIVKKGILEGLWIKVPGNKYRYTGAPIENKDESPKVDPVNRAKRAQLVFGAEHRIVALHERFQATNPGLQHLLACLDSDDPKIYPIRDRMISRDTESGRSNKKRKGPSSRKQAALRSFGALVVLAPWGEGGPLATAGEAILEYAKGNTAVFLRPTTGDLNEDAIKAFLNKDAKDIKRTLKSQIEETIAIGADTDVKGTYAISLIFSK